MSVHVHPLRTGPAGRASTARLSSFRACLALRVTLSTAGTGVLNKLFRASLPLIAGARHLSVLNYAGPVGRLWPPAWGESKQGRAGARIAGNSDPCAGLDRDVTRLAAPARRGFLLRAVLRERNQAARPRSRVPWPLCRLAAPSVSPRRRGGPERAWLSGLQSASPVVPPEL